MAARKIVDHRAGPLPDIRAEGTSIVYELDVPGVHPTRTLVVRCDSDGNVWASIERRPAAV